MKKRYKVSLVFGLVIFIFICGWLLRLDRFGFTSLDWVDFIEYKHELYVAVPDTNDTRHIVADTDIGVKVGEVKYTLQGKVRSSCYTYRNFDASFLEKGTPIYRIKDENKKNQLAIYIDGFYYLYQAEDD
jgi:hypothetical protein